MAINNSISTLNVDCTILSGTGTINIGNENSSKAITFGSTSGTSSMTIRSGGSTVSTLNIGTTVATNINIGNTTGATSVDIRTGGNSTNIGSSSTLISNIGNSTGATAIIIQSGVTTGTVTYPYQITTTSPLTLVSGVTYITNNASLTTLTLPTSAVIGSTIQVIGVGTGGWKIAQSSGQQIFSTASNTTSGATGTLSSGGRYDSVTMSCVVANNSWTIMYSVGTLAFV